MVDGLAGGAEAEAGDTGFLKGQKMAKKLAQLPRVTSKTITVGALLGKIKRLILAEPKRLNMERWVVALRGEVINPDFINPKPSCGTVGCMAGWGAILLSPSGVSGRRLDDRANQVMKSVIGFDIEDGSRVVGGLFSPCAHREEESLGVPGTREHAAVIAKRIDTYLSRHPEIVKRKIVVADVQKALRA